MVAEVVACRVPKPRFGKECLNLHHEETCQYHRSRQLFLLPGGAEQLQESIELGDGVLQVGWDPRLLSGAVSATGLVSSPVPRSFAVSMNQLRCETAPHYFHPYFC